MPEGESFIDFYTRIWNTEEINKAISNLKVVGEKSLPVTFF